jgi:hypothetical protein
VWCHSAKNSQVNHRNSENQNDQRITCVVYSAKTSELTAQIKEAYLQISELTSHIMFMDGHQTQNSTCRKLKGQIYLCIPQMYQNHAFRQLVFIHKHERSNYPHASNKLSSPDPENA